MTPNRLHRCRILAAACVLVGAGLSEAAAQFPPVPGQAPSQAQGQAASGSAFPPPPGAQQSSAFPPPPGQAPAQRQDPAFPPPPGQSQGAASGGFSPAQPGGFGGGGPGPSEAQKVCLTFPAIREDVEKGAAVIRAAGDRKAPREEVCPLFKSFAAKEGKMVSFLETNQKLCGVPPKIVTQVKANHAKTVQLRNTVCSTGPAAPAAGPTLSDALGGPVIADDTSAKLPGRGTFDTLTGNALQR